MCLVLYGYLSTADLLVKMLHNKTSGLKLMEKVRGIHHFSSDFLVKCGGWCMSGSFTIIPDFSLFCI